MREIVRSLGFFILVLATMNVAGAVSGDTIYARPGERISSGDGRLNFYCMGSGSPTVVFDAGFGDWSPSWAAVQPQVARWARACTYDRAGYAFSDPAVMPRTSARIADELHAALHDASLLPPYVLVAHAFGSYNLRVFADRYMRDVGGIVLVDADDLRARPAHGVMGGLSRAAAGDEDAAVVPIGLGRPEEMRFGASPQGVPRPAVRL